MPTHCPIALLHQVQREVKTVQHKGKPVRYIEVVPADIRVANRLAHEVLGRTLDELPPQTRRLLTALHAWVAGECARQSVTRGDFRFSRRQVRDITGWGDTQLRVHLERLVQMEYLIAHGGRRGLVFEYELLYDGQGADGGEFLMGLQDMDGIESVGTTPGSRGSEGDIAGPSRPQRGAIAGASRGDLIERQANAGAACEAITVGDEQNAPSEPRAPVLSYPQPVASAAVAAAEV